MLVVLCCGERRVRTVSLYSSVRNMNEDNTKQLVGGTRRSNPFTPSIRTSFPCRFLLTKNSKERCDDGQGDWMFVFLLRPRPVLSVPYTTYRFIVLNCYDWIGCTVTKAVV